MSASILVAVGLALIVLAYLWLVSLAFEVRVGWGLALLLFPPALLFFAHRRGRVVAEPLGVIAGGGLLAGLAAGGTGLIAFAGSAGRVLLRDSTSIALLLVGTLVVLVALAWLAVAAYRVRPLWSAGVVLVPPLIPVFAARHWRLARAPSLLLAIGLAVAAVPFGLTYYAQKIDLAPFETFADGERQLTLTGWNRRDYPGLRVQTDLAVLQMANPEVTDATLLYVEPLERLRVLDISHTQVTDAGLASIARLPALEELYLTGTRVTDRGVQQWLTPHPKLKRLDVRDTSVSTATLDAWRTARPGRRALR